MNETGEKVTIREVYDLVDRKVGDVNKKVSAVEEKVDNVQSKVSNIEGRLMMIPTLISIGISGFFLIINIIIKD